MVTSAPTAAAAFVTAEPELFRQRTAKVVLVGDAQREIRSKATVAVGGSATAGKPVPLTRHPSLQGREELVPDPSAANWARDMPAAETLFAACSEMEVSMVCLSRELSAAASVPTGTILV